MPDVGTKIAVALDALLGHMGAAAARVLLGPGSTYSLAAMACTLAVAVAFTLVRRGRPVPLRVLARGLFPLRLVRSASGRADIGFTAFNILLAPLLLGGALLAFEQVSGATRQLLDSAFGLGGMVPLPPLAAAALMTAAMFLAYEFAYWLDHYLSHKIPLLWQFHAVHHSAESLSLITAFRVHPVDTLVFYNIVVVVTGVTAGTLTFALGAAPDVFAIGGNNILLLASAVLLTHLHHSHLWMSFTGRLGRILLSPAHHQIHHSSDPAHHDRNFGNALAIFDRMFGTLHMPTRERQPIVFGVRGLDHDPHGLTGGLVAPFIGAARCLRPRLPKLRPPASVLDRAAP